MPLTIEGIEYLNSTEAAEFLGFSYVTFQKLTQDYKLQWFTIPGRGRQKFYKKADLEGLQKPQPGQSE